MNMKKYLLPFAFALSLTSCDEIIEEILNELPALDPSVEVNDSNWPFASWNDKSVVPGNDFFVYCIGKWYSRAKDNEGTNYESLKTINQYYNLNYYLNNDIKSLQTLLRDTAKVDDSNMKSRAEAYTKQWVDKVQAAKNRRELGNVIGQLICNGYQTVLSASVANIDGRMRMAIVSPAIYDYMHGGGDDDEALACKNHATNFSSERRFNTRLTSQMHPYDETTTRAVDNNVNDIVLGILDAMGLNTQNAICFADDDELVETCNASLTTLKKDIANMVVAFDLPFSSRAGLKKYNELAGTNRNYLFYISLLYDKYMNYEAAKYLQDKGFNDASHRKGLTNLCSEFKSTLKERINALKWMSAETKANAVKKLDAMKFFVGYPDNWYSQGISSLTGNSLVEDVHLLIKADFNIEKVICGKTASAAAEYYCPKSMNIATDNAFYTANFNTFFIFPCYMFEPYYREDVLDAYMYATVGCVIGHEMLHGFDNNGAQYDANGSYAVSDKAPYGWWTAADAQKYVASQQLLIDTYNRIPYEPWVLPGKFNDGERCLGENIADVASLQLCLDCYTRKLRGQDYTDDQVQQMQKLFFEAWAYGWRSKFGSDRMQYLYEKDVHSSYYARIIGPVQNCDTWYSLYNVVQGQKYYLAPAERCSMW